MADVFDDMDEDRRPSCWRDDNNDAPLPLLLVAVGALIDCDGRLLIARRPPHKPLPDLWEFPGGKLEKNESPEAALIRELREEIGINTVKSCLAPLAFASHRYDDFHLLMPVFACRQWQGNIQPCEGQIFKWVAASDLSHYAMPAATIPLIPLIRDILG